jgi:GMP synthase (glutamine-hydrolysing)
MSAPIVAILDFGSQFTQVIARRIRECQVHSKIFHYRTTAAELKAMGVTGVILSGGPASVKAANSPRPDPAIFELGVPVLGICYGMQLMGAMLGGEVAGSEKREYGHGTLTKRRDSKLLAGLPDTLKIWNSHGDKVTGLPVGFVSVASSDNADNAVIENVAKNY